MKRIVFFRERMRADKNVGYRLCVKLLIMVAKLEQNDYKLAFNRFSSNLGYTSLIY